MLTLNRKSNQDAVLIKYLKLLGENFNQQEVVAELEKHPNSPSMLAISDVLNWFKISNGAYYVGLDELVDVPVPFIAHTKNNNNFVVVSKLTDDSVTLSDHKRNNYKLTLSEFKDLYSGTVLACAEQLKIAGNKQDWLNYLTPYKIPAAILALAVAFISVVLFSGYASSLTWRLLTLTLFKTAGVITSVLLLVQSIDKNNPFVQTLCGGHGKTNCNAILTSEAATVFNGLTWSEVGFFYFAGTWLALLFAGNLSGMLSILAVLNLLSLPYTVYSIHFQARIAKQWCVLCTIVQALLWMEFIPLISTLAGGGKSSNVSIKISMTLFICFIIPASIWLLIKPLLLKSQQLKILKSQLHKFKYNTELFEAALKKQPKYAIPADDWSIVLGNVEANTIITIVSNPYCQPCSKVHAELDEWLEKLDNLQLRIVFAADGSDDDRKKLTISHLMSLNDQSDKCIVKQALHDWYGQKQTGYSEWAKLYPATVDENVDNILEKQRDWCDLAGITTTPTLLINGYRLPEIYRLRDIKYMMG